ncbi:uncharacterized protein A4U43_C04F35240 [Asparagus officinalis]|uniref:Uncharacterized protein n=1 Tax=Asparagus officinalis TaxID=4686 RepID=A0A5P1F5W4_ASPOF|nr:uncharacterized protein A4U43_C04F35240 [Asparagus officinalis]
MANDSVDKLVVFLAKRDGIDKLVKTFQYVSKLAHYRTDAPARWPARRAKRDLARSPRLQARQGIPGRARVPDGLQNAPRVEGYIFLHVYWIYRITRMWREEEEGAEPGSAEEEG